MKTSILGQDVSLVLPEQGHSLGFRNTEVGVQATVGYEILVSAFQRISLCVTSHYKLHLN